MSERREHGSLAIKLVLMGAGMFGFGYLMVPIYDVFCEVTGLNGKTADEAASVVEAPDPSRLVTVEFTGSVNQSAPWEFRPEVVRMQVHPGKLYDTTYFARNLTADGIVGHAVPSVVPPVAAKHFQKTDCFCFEEQQFAPNEGRDMPVRFIIDPELPAHINTLTLSYTFFARETVAAASGS